MLLLLPQTLSTSRLRIRKDRSKLMPAGAFTILEQSHLTVRINISPNESQSASFGNIRSARAGSDALDFDLLTTAVLIPE